MEVNKIYHGDAIKTLETFEEGLFDSFVTDPPYGISFMNKHWDYAIPSVELWKEVYRVLKPGAFILCACGTRTQHRMTVNIEDAGFEIRDIISWIYGSGFPKSLDISKAIDKQAGAEREQGSEKVSPDGIPMSKRTPNSKNSYHPSHNVMSGATKHNIYNSLPSTDAAKQWEGYGTALKPAQELWTLARKPLSEKTVAENVLKHGTGGINIDACRIEFEDTQNAATNPKYRQQNNFKQPPKNKEGVSTSFQSSTKEQNTDGRFPANVIFDEFMGQELDIQSGILKSGGGIKVTGRGEASGNGGFKLADRLIKGKEFEINEGGASRFFYCAKADSMQRNKGLKGFDEKAMTEENKIGRTGSNFKTGGGNDRNVMKQNHHPTVKPIELMRYLVKLITPKGGLTCDPYCGSGTTLIGAKLELINYVGIEREKDYVEISEARVAAWNPDKYINQTLF